MYLDVSVVSEGALADSVTFRDFAEFEQYLAGVEEDARADGYRVDVYVVAHDHPETVEECSCVQYLTDHHPYRTFNAGTAPMVKPDLDDYDGFQR